MILSFKGSFMRQLFADKKNDFSLLNALLDSVPVEIGSNVHLAMVVLELLYAIIEKELEANSFPKDRVILAHLLEYKANLMSFDELLDNCSKLRDYDVITLIEKINSLKDAHLASLN